MTGFAGIAGAGRATVFPRALFIAVFFPAAFFLTVFFFAAPFALNAFFFAAFFRAGLRIAVFFVFPLAFFILGMLTSSPKLDLDQEINRREDRYSLCERNTAESELFKPVKNFSKIT